jgi:hypothetical protein
LEEVNGQRHNDNDQNRKTKQMKVTFKNMAEVKVAIAFIGCPEVQAAKAILKRESDCKTLIIARLESERGITVGAIPEGEAVELTCDGASVNLNRIGKDRVDITLLRASHPDIAKNFTVRGIETHFKK